MGEQENKDVSQTEEKKETQPEAKDKVEETKSSTPTIDAAKKENDRKEELLKQEKELLDRKEEMIAKQMVGGSAEAGVGLEQKPDPVKYAKDLQKGEGNVNDFLNTDGD